MKVTPKWGKKGPGKGNPFHRGLGRFWELKVRAVGKCGKWKGAVVRAPEMMWGLLNNVKDLGPAFSFLSLNFYREVFKPLKCSERTLQWTPLSCYPKDLDFIWRVVEGPWKILSKEVTQSNLYLNQKGHPDSCVDTELNGDKNRCGETTQRWSLGLGLWLWWWGKF